MFVALVVLAILVIVLYSGMMIWLVVSFVRSRALFVSNKEQVPVHITVIIPLRNEAEHLSALCRDLSFQDYHLQDYEVIFVDDHSTDQSVKIFEKCCGEQSNYRMIRLPEGVTGKKHAIAAGVNAATGEWVIQSDADCRLPVGFISGHAGYAASGVGLVAGPVLVRPGASGWGRIEALEHLSLTATSLAAAAAGRPVMCSGANLSYSKRIYRELEDDLLAIPHASGDDVFFLAEAKKRNKHIFFTSAPEMLVTTFPTPGPLAFLQQRIRWGSKARHYRDPDMMALSVLVWLSNTVLTGFLIASLFVSGMVWFFLSALLLKSLSEYMLLRAVADRLGQGPLLRIFPAAVLFYYFYIAFTGILAMAGSFTWKGRRHTGS